MSADPDSVEGQLTLPQQLCLACMQLSVTASMIGCTSHDWPPIVHENWEDRLKNLIANIERETHELMDFGEAFDGEET